MTFLHSRFAGISIPHRHPRHDDGKIDPDGVVVREKREGIFRRQNSRNEKAPAENY